MGAVHPAVGVQLEMETDAHPAVQPAPPPPRAAPREAARPRRRRRGEEGGGGGGGGGGGRRGDVAARRPRLRPAGHLLPPGAGGQGEEEKKEERAHAAGGREGAAPHPAPPRSPGGGDRALGVQDAPPRRRRHRGIYTRAAAPHLCPASAAPSTPRTTPAAPPSAADAGARGAHKSGELTCPPRRDGGAGAAPRVTAEKYLVSGFAHGQATGLGGAGGTLGKGKGLGCSPPGWGRWGMTAGSCTASPASAPGKGHGSGVGAEGNNPSRKAAFPPARGGRAMLGPREQPLGVTGGLPALPPP